MSFNFDNVIKQSEPIHKGYTPSDKNIGTNPDIFTYEMLPNEPISAQFKGVNGFSQIPTHGLQPEQLVMNFGTYLYNQTTGTAPNQL